MDFVIIIGLILFNGVLSMTEIALVSVRKSKLEGQAKKGNKAAQTALRLAKEPDKFFSTIQIGITLIGILTGLYSGEVFSGSLAMVIGQIPALSPYALIISKTIIVILVTYATLVFGELIPKRLGLNKSEQISKLLARPMVILSLISHPFVWILSKSTTLIMKLLGVDGTDQSKVTEEEIKAIVKEGLKEGQIEEVEHDIVERVFNLGDRDVNSIMTYRADIVCLDLKESKQELKKKVMHNMHDVYPVISDGLDNLVGVVHLKELFGRIDAEDFSLNDIVSIAEFIPESKSVYNTLMQFKHRQSKYGIVIDEFGSVQGIVTQQDIMDALVGQIHKKGQQRDIIERHDGSCLIDGQCSFYNVLEHYDVEYLYIDHSYNTLSGLILEILRHIPQEGQKVKWKDFEFEIIDMDGIRIDKVLAHKTGNNKKLTI